jgi:DNA-binding CsgD family transcriptional regulator
MILTTKQHDILQYLAYGFSRTQVSQILHIKQGTLKNHLNSIYEKLTANNLSHALFIAFCKGIIE